MAHNTPPSDNQILYIGDNFRKGEIMFIFIHVKRRDSEAWPTAQDSRSTSSVSCEIPSLRGSWVQIPLPPLKVMIILSADF